MLSAIDSAAPSALPRIVELSPSQDPLAWLARERPRIEGWLSTNGGVLLRGLAERFDEAAGLVPLFTALLGPLLDYRDRATPRTELAPGVYTATDYPPDHSIFLHNENAFAARWPMRIGFYCAEPAEAGGETPIADVRRVLARLTPRVRRTFEGRGVLYVRNFTEGPFGLRWQTAFGTDDVSTLEAFCAAAEIETEWPAPGHLRTRQVRPALAIHPGTGEAVWFNHAAALHISTLPERRRRALLKLFEEADLPVNTYYADGAPIEPETLEAIRRAYREETATRSWHRGDLLILDNMLVAHGRNPYRGKRAVYAAMGQPMTWKELST